VPHGLTSSRLLLLSTFPILIFPLRTTAERAGRLDPTGLGSARRAELPVTMIGWMLDLAQPDCSGSGAEVLITVQLGNILR
jgi:hypothetical protein